MIISQKDQVSSYQKFPLSEQSKCAPHFGQNIWHACISTILLSHLGHLISSMRMLSNLDLKIMSKG
jgi:hypothetical protein